MPTSDRLKAAIEACKRRVCQGCKGQGHWQTGPKAEDCRHCDGRGWMPTDLTPAVAELNAAWREQADALAAALRDLASAATWEANEKGAGGYLLARLTDAREALAAYDAAKGGTDGK